LIPLAQSGARQPAAIFLSLSWLWPNAPHPRFSRANPWPALASSCSNPVTSLTPRSWQQCRSEQGGGGRGVRRRWLGADLSRALGRGGDGARGGAPSRPCLRRWWWPGAELPPPAHGDGGRASSPEPAAAAVAAEGGAPPSPCSRWRWWLGPELPRACTWWWWPGRGEREQQPPWHEREEEPWREEEEEPWLAACQ
jgi:hypothetical protein